ncbi:MAG: T9SS type A sorting domain-containing protein [Candidatus Delongbacteria bacterium]|nr:T9SS type A sorting domain-containing protein [Candidatus Delongbacteria bacterium]MBN2835899.1 T9SS type A sorting domain-containing protein [Candidatus Delongbacteria bacterium]
MKKVVLLLITVLSFGLMGASASFDPQSYSNNDGVTANTVRLYVSPDIEFTTIAASFTPTNGSVFTFGSGTDDILQPNSYFTTDISGNDLTWYDVDYLDNFYCDIEFITDASSIDVNVSFSEEDENYNFSLLYQSGAVPELKIYSAGVLQNTPSWNAGKVVMNTTSEDWMSFSVKNDGNADANISSVYFTGSGFNFVTGQELVAGVLAQNASQTFRIEFAPLSNVLYSGSLVINYDGAKASTVINLSGNGIETLSAGVVQVGNQYVTADKTLPVDPSINYSISQTIYPYSELGLVNGKQISSLFYQYNGLGIWSNLDVDVYISTTSDLTFSDTNWKVLPVDPVFSGNINPTIGDEWISFELPTPYLITSTDNIVVTVIEKSSNAALNGGAFWSSNYADRTLFASSATIVNIGSLPSAAIKSYSPNTRFYFTDAPINPTFSVSNIIWNYGYIQTSTTSAKQFTITNTGGDGLVVNSISVVDNTVDNEFVQGAGCGTGLAQSLLAAGTYNFTVNYSPLNNGNDTGARVKVDYNDGVDKTEYISLSGFGYPGVGSGDNTTNAISVVSSLVSGSASLINSNVPYANDYLIQTGAVGNDVVYNLTLTDAFKVDLSLLNSNFDTVLGVFNDSNPSSSNFLYRNDDYAGSKALQSALYDLALTAGTYYIVVDGKNSSGNSQLDVSLELNPIGAPTPSNGDTGIATDVTLQWGASSSADGYLVSLWYNNGVDDVYLLTDADTPTNSISTGTTLMNNVTYYWIVKNYNNTHGTIMECTNCPTWSFSTEDVQVDNQSVSILEGWNIVSSYINPAENNMKNVFNSISSEILIVKDGEGNVFSPTLQSTTSMVWNVVDGYKVKASSNQNLVLSGSKVLPAITDIDLVGGWSMKSYLKTLASPVEIEMASILADLYMVKSSSGDVYVPQWNVNYIGNLLPGQGYKFNMQNPATLNYTADSKSMVKTEIIKHTTPSYFNDVKKAENNMIVIFTKESITNLELGDEIAAYIDGNLVGSTVVENNNVAMAIWGDVNGSQIVMKVYDSSSDKVYELSNVTFIQGDLTYMVDELSVVDGFEMLTGVNESLPTVTKLYQNYPNPFNPETSIRFDLAETSNVKLIVYNSVGQEVVTLVNGVKEAGRYNVMWNIANVKNHSVSSGIYYYLLMTDKYNSVNKMILMK